MAGDSVLFIWYLFPFTLFGNFFFPLDASKCSFIVFYVFSLLGMKRISSFWEYVVPIGHKLLCHRQFYPATVCILGFLQLLPMLQQLIAVSQCSIIQGCECCLHFHFWYFFIRNYNAIFDSYIMGRASPSEFVIPLSKYIKAVYHTRVSVGMRFRMLFETEESSVRRYFQPSNIFSYESLDLFIFPM